ncbi:MAG TPA: isoprenylcysteine carboxylmethyltransferase family protein [Terriglobales bacterium]|nr:isoprenylcysteine carboxylmethyltransferase family protein [Terriglobales bacterium]
MVGPNILLTLIVGAALASIVWKYPPPAWTFMQSIGVCLMLAGFVLWTTARFQLGKSLTVTAQAKQLVTRGLYSKFRNPVYLFGSCTIAGLILLLGRPLWLLIFVIVIPLQLWRSRKEAQVLEAKFGDEYRAYRARTWF